MSLPASEIDELRDFALTMARAAGDIALRYFRARHAVMNKATDSGFDPVTEADQAIERDIRAQLAARFPAHGIAGEEFGSSAGTGEWRWYIDPIDGTRAFMTGMPLWGTLIGLMHGSDCVLGLMHQPVLRETFVGANRVSELRSDAGRRRLETRPTTRLEQAILYSTSPDLFDASWEAGRFHELARRCLMRRFGGDCYAYCMLAMGFVDLVVEAGLAPHDIVALIPIIEGAGGRVTTWDNGPAHGGGRILAAANPDLHGEALRVLQQDAP